MKDNTVDESNPKELEYNDKLWMIKFPTVSNFQQRKKLRLTDVGSYSIGKYETSLDLIHLIKQQWPFATLPIITETHGGVGGFSILLAQYFRIVNIIEINPLHMEIIKNNLEAININIDRLNFYRQDYLNIYKDLKQDIVISDPPWGGKSYKETSTLKLFINNINILNIINELFINNLCSIYILLAPQNFDFIDFITLLDNKLSIFIIRSLTTFFIVVKNK